MGHPDGLAAGLAARRQAWEAAMPNMRAANRRSPVQWERSADEWAYPCLVWGPYRGAAVMEVMESGGVPSALFLDPPGPVDLAESSAARAIGIAGGDRDEPGAGQSADRRDAGRSDRRAYTGREIGHSVNAGGYTSGHAAR